MCLECCLYYGVPELSAPGFAHLVNNKKESSMIIIVNSKVNGASIQGSLGKPEYSYYFLLQQFMPALEQIAQVIHVESNDEVDPLYKQLSETGEDVLFLSISPPHQTPVDLYCPTVCLFAWEFPDAPDRAWDNEPRHDWRYVFSRISGAIACSQESAKAIRILMGQDYPVTAIPSPVWAHFGDLLPEDGWLPCLANRSFRFTGHVIDSLTLGLSADGLVQHMKKPPRYPSVNRSVSEQPGALKVSLHLFSAWMGALIRNHMPRKTQHPKGQQPPPSQAGTQEQDDCHLELSGVIFCSIFNPLDGRKNWVDIVTAFCWAFRDNAEATLILKMTHHDRETYRITLLTLLSRLAPFQCRVLTLHGFLNDEKYRELITLTDFYVNASNAEGLCLPLMEFLSNGKPALAPRHTAMLDYLDDRIARIVDTSEELASWSHDPAGTLSSRRHRLNWESLMQGFRECHELAYTDPARYQRMSLNGWMRMQALSDTPVIAEQLKNFLAPLVANQEVGV